MFALVFHLKWSSKKSSYLDSFRIETLIANTELSGHQWFGHWMNTALHNTFKQTDDFNQDEVVQKR